MNNETMTKDLTNKIKNILVFQFRETGNLIVKIIMLIMK